MKYQATRILAVALLLILSITGLADERYQVPGLSRPAEIRVDEWGVPHIYAQSQYDAFFVQGFNAARDRLWQIDLWRRRGLGELSEILGPAFLEQDKAARMFLYRGDMFREWLAYGNDAKKISQLFTAGINAYIDLIGAKKVSLPVEFHILGYQPARWKPADVVRIRSNGLWRNVSSEAQRARIICKYGLKVDAKRSRLEPPWETQIPEGLNPCDVPEDVTRLYRLAKAPVDFSRAIQFGAASGRALQPLPDRGRRSGSNNWAVSPARTSTGRPILANDPHRGHALPSLRYVAHLVAPGLNVIGAGEPALPGISIGHNEHIAFGLTIFPIDQEDLMVYEVRDNQYRYQNAWLPFKTVTETFQIRDAEPVQSVLKFTVHGPVIYENDGHAFAVQAAWLQPGMAPYFGSVEYMRANNWDQFLAALNRWGAPAENQVYADIEGNIGYKPAGLTPIRTNYDGLLPVPGDGRYEWQGFYDMDQLPVQFNPKRGWVGTANAMSLPPDYPYRKIKPGFEWATAWRINRITETLDAQPRHSLEDSLALQRDYLSIPARTILGALKRKRLPEPAKSLFSSWDYRLERDSGAAALFEFWFSRYLNKAVMHAVLPGVDLDDLGYLDNQRVVEYFIAMPQDQRQQIASQTLTAAATALEKTTGAGPDRWRWGQIHTIQFQHPLAPYVDQPTREQLWVPKVSRGGSGDTTNSTRYNRDFKVVSGASWRMVLDVGYWDHAYMTNAPGQSGNPGSEHYDDLLIPWANDDQLPLIYSRKLVEQHTRSVITLTPR